MKEKTVQELKSMIDNKEDFQLIDVREQYEFDAVNINGELIPMNTVPHNLERISKDKPVVVHCKAGSRSATIVQFLEMNYGYSNLYNLKGGVLAWVNEIDPSLPKY